MRTYIHHIVALAFITCMAGILVWRNYIPGTMLAGWDDLHHEFDFGLAFSRAIEGVWRADQGLGTVAGHSHMSDIPRMAILWIVSLVIPASSVRFVFVSLSLFMGVWGMYACVYRLSSDFGHHLHDRAVVRIATAVIASLVYMLNLGVVQQFILPFEMFMVQFALLPWLICSAYEYLHTHQKTTLLAFAIISIFYSSTAYAATLWYVFFGIFVLWIAGYIRKNTAVHALLLLAVCVAVNLYWIAPNMYFAVQRGHEVRSSKINTIFSPDMFAANKQFGHLSDALLLKGFLFDWNLYDYENKEFVQIMQQWRAHLEDPLVRAAGYAMTGAALLGVGLAVALRNRNIAPFSLFLLVPLLMLVNDTWPMSLLYEWLSTLSPLAKEALRTPFTKVSIPAAFGLALFVGFSFSFVAYIRRSLRVVVLVGVGAGILWFGYPAFHGAYIHHITQIHMPQQYQEVFTYFRAQPAQARVALFPIHTFWNWTYYTWGYQGAGFLQFGMPQPILDRDYDRWSKYNEDYNRQMSYALYAQNPSILAHTVNKYNIDYVVVDTSVFEPSLPTQHSLLHWLLPEFIASTQLFEDPRAFGENILVYKRKDPLTPSVYMATDVTELAQDYAADKVDKQYISVKDYAVRTVPDTSPSPQTDHSLNPSPNVLDEISADFSSNRWSFCAEHADDRSGRFTQNGSIMYEAHDTNICETVLFETADHSNAYQLSITHQNLEGRPIMICFKNMLTGHCDINEQLSFGAKRQTDTFEVPSLWDFGIGYQLELTTIARGRGMSKNAIHEVVLRKIEDDFPVREISRNITPIEFQDISRYKKLAVIEATPQELQSKLLILNQAYSPGWIGFSVQSSRFMVHGFEMYLPTLVLLPHVKVNGWANAWLLEEQPKPANQSLREAQRGYAKPNGKMGRGWNLQNSKSEILNSKSLKDNEALSIPDSAEISKGKQQSDLSTMNHAPSTMNYAPSTKVLLLFWPQYLQYAGFGIGVMTAGLIAIAYVRREVIK